MEYQTRRHHYLQNEDANHTTTLDDDTIKKQEQETKKQSFHLLTSTSCMENDIVSRFRSRYSRHAAILLFELDNSIMRRFMNCQEKFGRQGKPTKVTVAFHYTRAKNIDSIQQEGLCYKDQPIKHGAVFGDGIYVATNPDAFSSFGEVGLVCLILPGVSKQRNTVGWDNELSDEVDSYLGNKLLKRFGNSNDAEFPKSSYFDEVILAEEEQVVPVCAYTKDVVNNKDLLFDLTCFWQHSADHFFNDKQHTSVHRVYPAFEDLQYEHIVKYNAQKRNWSKTAHVFQTYYNTNSRKSNFW